MLNVLWKWRVNSKIVQAASWPIAAFTAARAFQSASASSPTGLTPRRLSIDKFLAGLNTLDPCAQIGIRLAPANFWQAEFDPKQ